MKLDYFKFVIRSLLLLGAISIFSFNCVEEQCLAHGENCSQSYLQANYGTTSVPCCNSGEVCQKMFSYSTQVTCN